ncbi:MAG: response regulator, partial [Candidatus Zixiibacteriota bacterium]
AGTIHASGGVSINEISDWENCGDRKTRVLLMEPDDFNRDLIALLLTSRGFTVETASNSSEILNKYRAAHCARTPFDIVLLDFVTARATANTTTIEKLQTINPTITAVALCGHHDHPIVSKPEIYGFANALPKPVDPVALVNAILCPRNDRDVSSRT